MKREVRHTILKEGIWLLAIVVASALIELFIIELLGLHPVLSVKIQGFIGLLIIGLGIRAVTRIRTAFRTHPDPDHNGQDIIE